MDDPAEHNLAVLASTEGGHGKLSISCRLCGKEGHIIFSKRHLIDLQELLKQLRR
jgi:hypothetical protein